MTEQECDIVPDVSKAPFNRGEDESTFSNGTDDQIKQFFEGTIANTTANMSELGVDAVAGLDRLYRLHDDIKGNWWSPKAGRPLELGFPLDNSTLLSALESTSTPAYVPFRVA